jgi:hypothetical protein
MIDTDEQEIEALRQLVTQQKMLITYRVAAKRSDIRPHAEFIAVDVS